MPEQRIDVNILHCYEKRASAADVATRWLAAARRYLPEALPVRFGDTEPLRNRFDTAGDDGLRGSFHRADGLLFLQCTLPVMGASLATPNRPPYWGPVHGHSMSTMLPVTDERLRRFALALVDDATIYLSASTVRGMILDGEDLVGPATDPGEPFLAPLGRWHGLPAHPPAWCWFGRDYAKRLRRSIIGEPHGSGLLYTGGPWIPTRFQARFDQPEPSLRRAPSMPRGLR